MTIGRWARIRFHGFFVDSPFFFGSLEEFFEVDTFVDNDITTVIKELSVVAVDDVFSVDFEFDIVFEFFVIA